METLIRKENIVMIDSASTWQQAIQMSAQPLIDHGFIEPRYVDAIFDNVNKFGPYFVLAPEIAMPHASPADGVHEKQISLLVLRQPIRFSENGFDVRLVFTLAATDSESHLDGLRHLAEIFAEEERTQALVEAKTVDEVMSLLHSNNNSKGGIV